MYNYFLLSLLALTYFLQFPSPEYVNMIKRRDYMYVDLDRKDDGMAATTWLDDNSIRNVRPTL